MTTPYSGLPANVLNNLPAAKSIASTTNATPIVVTTTAPHGLSPGDYLVVTGATDPAANDAWRAGTCTATTVALVTLASGASSVGTLAGGAVGTLAPAIYGTTAPLLSDGDPPAAALWNVPYEAGFDRAAWLLFVTNYAMTIKAGGFLTIAALARVIGTAGSLFTGVFDFISTSLVKIKGRRVRGLRQPLSDADHTVLVTDGNRFTLSPTPAAARTITLKSTGTVPDANETLEFICDDVTTPVAVYTFEREDTTIICTFTGSATATINRCWAEFEFSSGAWHLGATSGSAWDGAADYGVLPGAGV